MKRDSHVWDVLGFGELAVELGLLQADLRLNKFRTLRQRRLAGKFQVHFFR